MHLNNIYTKVKSFTSIEWKGWNKADEWNNSLWMHDQYANNCNICLYLEIIQYSFFFLLVWLQMSPMFIYCCIQYTPYILTFLVQHCCYCDVNCWWAFTGFIQWPEVFVIMDDKILLLYEQLLIFIVVDEKTFTFTKWNW